MSAVSRNYYNSFGFGSRLLGRLNSQVIAIARLKPRLPSSLELNHVPGKHLTRAPDMRDKCWLWSFTRKGVPDLDSQTSNILRLHGSCIFGTAWLRYIEIRPL